MKSKVLPEQRNWAGTEHPGKLREMSSSTAGQCHWQWQDWQNTGWYSGHKSEEWLSQSALEQQWQANRGMLLSNEGLALWWSSSATLLKRLSPFPCPSTFVIFPQIFNYTSWEQYFRLLIWDVLKIFFFCFKEKADCRPNTALGYQLTLLTIQETFQTTPHSPNLFSFHWNIKCIYPGEMKWIATSSTQQAYLLDMGNPKTLVTLPGL